MNLFIVLWIPFGKLEFNLSLIGFYLSIHYNLNQAGALSKFCRLIYLNLKKEYISILCIYCCFNFLRKDSSYLQPIFLFPIILIYLSSCSCPTPGVSAAITTVSLTPAFAILLITICQRLASNNLTQCPCLVAFTRPNVVNDLTYYKTDHVINVQDLKRTMYMPLHMHGEERNIVTLKHLVYLNAKYLLRMYLRRLMWFFKGIQKKHSEHSTHVGMYNQQYLKMLSSSSSLQADCHPAPCRVIDLYRLC